MRQPVEAAKISLIGDRPKNQDRCLYLSSPKTILLGLADGLGGHPRGEIAAQLLIDVSETLFRQARKPLPDPQHFMLLCIGKAHELITRFGRRQTPPVAPRTTAVLAIVQDASAHWVHVGDSRLYLIRDGQVHARTRDHSHVRFVRESATKASRAHSSLTRCLGGMVQPPVTTCGPNTPLQQGDTLLLCSDGLWGQVPSTTLIGALSHPAAALEQSLQSLARRAGETPNSDNITAVAMRWLAPDAASRPAESQHSAPPNAPPDHQLDHAIEHLNSMLEKSGQARN